MSKENPNELKIINKNERLKYQKLLYKYKQQIADLEAKLAESEETIKNNSHNKWLKAEAERYKNEYQSLKGYVDQLKQQLAEKEKEETKTMEDFEKGCQEYYKSNQKAIEELRLALDNFRNRPTYFDVARQELCLSEQDKQFIDFISNRIKELGGEDV